MQLSKSSLQKNYFEISPEALLIPDHLLSSQKIKHLGKASVLSKPLQHPSLTLPYIKHSSQGNKLLQTCQSLKQEFQVFSKTKLLQDNTIKKLKQESPVKDCEGDDQVFAKGKILIIDKIVYKKASAPAKNNKSMNLSPIPTGFLASQFKYDDTYSYTKFMRNHDVTPFNKLISVKRDSNIASFPYLTKIMKEIRKIESACVAKHWKKPKAYAECCCSIDKNICYMRERPSDEDLIELCDSPEVFSIKNYQTLCPETFVFVVFEGVIGFIQKHTIKLRRGGLKFLKDIQNFFKVVIISTTVGLSSQIQQVLEAKAIRISIFLFLSQSKVKEFVNLESVFKSLEIVKPEVQVLLISSLDLEVNRDDQIFPKVQRLSQNLNIKPCPVSNSRQPTTFLVPHILISSTSKPLDQLFVSIKGKIGLQGFSFVDWLKSCRGKFKVICSSRPYEKIMNFMPLKELCLKCNLHRTAVRMTEELPSNYFVLYFD